MPSPGSALSPLANASAMLADALTPLEAAHASAAVGRALDALALLSVVRTAQAEELTRSVGEEISRMLGQQQALERRFHELIAEQPALRAQTNKASLRRNQAQLQEVSEALRAATKQLCRNLRDNPDVPANLAKVAATRESVAALLSATLDALALQATAAPVVEAVVAAEQAQADRRGMIEAEQQGASLITSLRSDLATEKQQHGEQMRDKRRAVLALKAQLQHEKLQLAVDASYRARDLAASNQTSVRLQQADLAGMQLQLELLQQQLEVERSVRAATVGFLSAKAAGLQEASAGWHARRDEDGQAKERELEVLRVAHSRAQERLAEAEGRLREEAAAKAARDAKAQQEAELRAADAALAARQLAATIRIQAAWRGFKARQLAKGERGKQAKGGAKKGKKKK